MYGFYVSIGYQLLGYVWQRLLGKGEKVMPIKISPFVDLN
jgi:hypothetical protein